MSDLSAEDAQLLDAFCRGSEEVQHVKAPDSSMVLNSVKQSTVKALTISGSDGMLEAAVANVSLEKSMNAVFTMVEDSYRTNTTLFDMMLEITNYVPHQQTKTWDEILSIIKKSLREIIETMSLTNQIVGLTTTAVGGLPSALSYIVDTQDKQSFINTREIVINQVRQLLVSMSNAESKVKDVNSSSLERYEQDMEKIVKSVGPEVVKCFEDVTDINTELEKLYDNLKLLQTTRSELLSELYQSQAIADASTYALTRRQEDMRKCLENYNEIDEIKKKLDIDINAIPDKIPDHIKTTHSKERKNGLEICGYGFNSSSNSTSENVNTVMIYNKDKSKIIKELTSMAEDKCEKIKQEKISGEEKLVKLKSEQEQCKAKAKACKEKLKLYETGGSEYHRMFNYTAKIDFLTEKRERMLSGLASIEKQYGTSGKYLMRCLTKIKTLAKLRREQLEAMVAVSSLVTTVIFNFSIPLRILNDSNGDNLSEVRRVCLRCSSSAETMSAPLSAYYSRLIAWKEKNFEKTLSIGI